MADHLKPVVSTDPAAHVPLRDNPTDVREQSAAILSRAQRIARVLNSPAAHPDVRAQAKDSLVALSKEALTLWSLV
jgi:hypothetical protein